MGTWDDEASFFPFFIFIYLICVCTHGRGCTHATRSPGAGIRENSLRELILFYHVGAGKQTQVVGFGSIYQLSHPHLVT